MLDEPHNNSVQYFTAIYLRTFAMCAVNCFGLISGFVGYREKEEEHKYTNWILLWLQIQFYNIVIALIFYFVDSSPIDVNQSFRDFLPIWNNEYWYFTAYTALFVCTPLINVLVRNLSRKQLKNYSIVVLLVFCFYESCKGEFGFGAGYSFIWLTFLYFFGAVIKKTEFYKRLKPLKCLIGIVLLTIVSWIPKAIIEYMSLPEKINLKVDFMWNSYVTPTFLVIAVFWLIIFANYKPGKKMQRMVKFSGESVFSAYIINEHPLFRKYVMINNFRFMLDIQVILLVMGIIGLSVAFVFISILIDHIRIYLFDLLKLKKRIYAIEGKARTLKIWN